MRGDLEEGGGGCGGEAVSHELGSVLSLVLLIHCQEAACK